MCSLSSNDVVAFGRYVGMTNEKQTMRTKRLDTGFYRITVAGRTWEAMTMERWTEGEKPGGWILHEIEDDEMTGPASHPQWWNNFWSLWECKEAILAGIAAGD